jgi:pectin methylesterase-like acyl-CoA thioesterase
MSKARLGSSRSSTLAIVLTLTLLLALSMPTPVSAATLRVRPSGGPGYFTTIQAAVNAANANDVILVYPGTYGPVELSTMATPGNISVIAVDSSGNPTPGTVTVNGGASSAFAWSLLPHLGGVTIDGFVVTSTGGYGVYIPGTQGDVVVRNVTADGTGKAGISVSITAPSPADVTVEGCSANSGYQGIWAYSYGGGTWWSRM